MAYNVTGKWVVIEGLPELVAKLRTYGDRVYRKHARRAMTKAGRIMAARAKATAPRETGLLALSLASKVVTYAKSNTVVVVTGSRKGFKRAVRKTKRGKLRYAKKGAMGKKYRNPINYLHLVELGWQPTGRKAKGIPQKMARQMNRALRKIKRFITFGRRTVQGRHFMKHAFETSKYQMLATIQTELGVGIEQEATASA